MTILFESWAIASESQVGDANEQLPVIRLRGDNQIDAAIALTTFVRTVIGYG
jgi:hypothetical protein